MEKIIFYKLESPYSEDETRNCKLTLTEMDSNFLTFKDNDISGGTFDEENKVLYITRNNGENIVIDLSSLSSGSQETIHEIEYKTPQLEVSGSFNNGHLTLTLGYSGAPETQQSITIDNITGGTSIIVHDVERIYHDATFIGNGTEDSPFRQNPAYHTNSYKPCLSIVTEIPNNPTFGDRYIYKYNTTNIGYLYDSASLDVITEALDKESSPWRIPTKADWDLLLNLCEDYGSHKNHNSEEDGIYGGMAAYKLEAKTGWTSTSNIYDFSIVPCPYSTSQETISAGFWTSTDNKVKLFTNKKTTVEQKTIADNSMYSIRLVANKLDTNIILGKQYNIVHIPAINQYWIKENLSFSNAETNTILPNDKYATKSEKWSIIQWNGDAWLEFELNTSDEVSTLNANTETKYTVGPYSLIKISKTTFLNDGSTKTVVDAGWY